MGEGDAIRAATRKCPTCGDEFPADFVVCPRDATPLDARPAAEDPLVGAVLAGTYRVTRVIADGGMGRVYEAEHTRLERKVAVKVLHDLYAKLPDGVARFEREARAASRVSSPHVVGVLDVLRAPDGRPCIVEELVAGEDLQARLDRLGRLSHAEALPLARQLCRALAVAHAQGVIHRDLKPSNVLLETADDGAVTVKILDFGVAKVAGDAALTQTEAVLGTPAYMAPEQARGSANVDARADLYAVGAVLYRMLTGRPPFEGSDGVSPLAKLLREEPPRPRSIDRTIPEGIEAVIQRAMAREPANRPASALDLELELAMFDRETALTPAGAEGLAGVNAATRAATPTAAIPAVGGRDAAEITRRARRARPLAVAVVAAAGAAVGLSLSTLLGAIVAAASGVLSTAERMLVLFVSIAAAIGALAWVSRLLAAAWRSVPAVQRLSARLGAALAVGVGVLGALELATRGWKAVSASPGVSVGSVAVRVALAVAAAVVTLLRGRRAPR